MRVGDDSFYSKFCYSQDNDFFGARISLSKDGTTLAVGSPLSVSTIENDVRTGHVKIFRRDLDNAWNLVETIEGRDDLDHFGTSVAVSEFGNIIAIGC